MRSETGTDRKFVADLKVTNPCYLTRESLYLSNGSFSSIEGKISQTRAVLRQSIMLWCYCCQQVSWFQVFFYGDHRLHGHLILYYVSIAVENEVVGEHNAKRAK